MAKPKKEDWREQARELSYSGSDRELWIDLGFFCCWFGLAELNLTQLLMRATQSRDVEAFSILCKGLDARAKLERFETAAPRVGGIGPTLKKRLATFDKARKVRNKLMHSGFGINEDAGPRRYYLSGLANMPWEELKQGPALTKQKPTIYKSLELYAWGVWLSHLCYDLSAAFRCHLSRGVFEIDHPQSMERPEDHLPLQRPDGFAMPDMPLQTTPEILRG